MFHSLTGIRKCYQDIVSLSMTPKLAKNIQHGALRNSIRCFCQGSGSDSGSKSRINLIENDAIIELTWQSNKANFLNNESMSELTSMLDEIEHPNNKSKYYQKPIILTTDSNKIFSAGMDLNTILKYVTDKNATTQEIETKIIELFNNFEKLMYRLMILNHRTVGEIKGHAIAGGFFAGLTCDSRIGWDNINYDDSNESNSMNTVNTSKIGINEIDIGVPFPSLPYLLVEQRLSNNINWQIMLSEANQMYSVKDGYEKLGYFNKLSNGINEIRKDTIKEALRVKKDSMNAYLSVKQYQLNTLIKKYENEKVEAMNEFARVLQTKESKQRLNQIVEQLNSKTRN